MSTRFAAPMLTQHVPRPVTLCWRTIRIRQPLEFTDDVRGDVATGTTDLVSLGLDALAGATSIARRTETPQRAQQRRPL